MLTYGIVLIISGLLALAGGFIAAALNMGNKIKVPPSQDGLFDAGFFKRHVFTMIPMSLGGLMAALGAMIVIIHFIEKLLS